MNIKEFTEMVTNHSRDVPLKISDAIQPLNKLTMPIVVLVLENYAKVLKNDPDFDGEFYATLKGSLRGITVKSDAENPESAAAFEEIMAECKKKQGRR